MGSFRSGVARGVLAYALAVAALATLSPFDFQQVPGRGLALLVLIDDVLRNLLLLFPAGFLYALAERERLGERALRVLGLGLSFGLALELTQLFLPSRHPNLVDVLANGSGAWLGALAERRLGRKLEALLSEELVLELPLTGALYLLAPLLMVHGLGSAESTRAWLFVPLGLFAAPIAAALYRERLSRTGALSRALFIGYAALGFAVLALPALLRHPLPVLVAALALGLATWVALARASDGAPQRRFEAPTILRALPWFVLYLVGLVSEASAASRAVTLAGNLSALQLVGACSAFTLFGYLLGELGARRMAVAVRLPLTLLVGAAMGLLFELGRSDSTFPGAHLRTLALGASAMAGAALHAAQVTLVQALRQRRRAMPTSTVTNSAGSAPPA